MEYNTTRGRLIIPEYGRNVQKMIENAVAEPDRDKRNNLARIIIKVMGQINPHLRDIADFNHKLWDHLFIISDFKLDVDSPYPIPTSQILDIKPEQLSYKTKKFRYMHYGRNIEMIIEKISTLEEGPIRTRLSEGIAQHMKKSYLNWNRESVNDDLILEHLEIMSKGKIKLDTDFRFRNSNDILEKLKRPSAASQARENGKGSNRNNNGLKRYSPRGK